MPPYRVSREIETVVTGHASATSVAKRDAAARVERWLTAAGDDRLAGVDATAAGVYEHPAGPFEPYRITVRATLTVGVDAADEAAARDAADAAVGEILARSDLPEWSYRSPPAVVG
ncbi:hypothetical protein BRC83_02775 [Halobacteriales archaeon QS_1_68_17]|nr:MAG: hypothetical protein BRC83_02775 [Halobacteriales archaeon QS_1_68_17]